jgi:transcriptional regulator of met regulon
MAYGRPLKGKSRRVPITVHAPIDTLDIIDEYTDERDQQQDGAYSRSDFYNEAATFYLKHLGRLPEDEQETLGNERTKNVPKKIRERNNHDNRDNLNNENGQKQGNVT